MCAGRSRRARRFWIFWRALTPLALNERTGTAPHWSVAASDRLAPLPGMLGLPAQPVVRGESSGAAIPASGCGAAAAIRPRPHDHPQPSDLPRHGDNRPAAYAADVV